MSKVIFDGVGEQPELNRITAKKNYASSSQSHKMGATAMFNDILHYLAKEKYPNLLNEVGGNVAVRQHPVYAFEKTLIEGTKDQYNRKFIGLYTVGADKGDKDYFGFTDASIKDKAIRLEGTDHLKGVGFNYPWEVNGVKNIRYNHDKKALCIVTGDDPTKWTALFEQSYCGTAKTEAAIEAYLEAKFKPAYDCAYYNNPLLVGTSMTLEQINADTEAFGNLRRSDFRPYSQCEFWIDGEYDVYYLNQERGVYEKNGINILTDLGISESSLNGLSIEEKNNEFIKARVARFKSKASEHYCIDDAIYQLMFLYIIVATDNFEKNMYPYLMDLLWRFFQDDLDSIFSTDNQGQDTKKYSAELHDFTDDRKAAYVFKGEDSALWQLIERAYPIECKKMGRDILQAMYEMATSGTTTVERLMSFFDDYFFKRAQNYFTPSAYNNDTEYAYEEAWNNKEYVASVDIHPLAQALGSHETTERAWLEKRIIFLMSKFGFGGYASASDTALGIISVRTQVKQSFTLTPAIDSYPTMLGGQSQVASAENRVMAGESVELKDVGEGNTNIYFVGADWLSDIGDLKDIKIDPSSDVKLSVSSKRLRRLKVGDKTQEVTSYLPKLEVMRCDSLESVDARRLASLVGTVDLSQCPRLIEAFFGGTNVDGVKIAKGSKIERLQLPDSVYSLDLQDVKFLETFELGTVGNLAFLRIENVPSVNGFAILKSAYNTDGQRLKDIRLIGFTYNGDANDVTMLSNIASDKDKDGNEHVYNGIDSNGVPNTSNPELQGTLNISGGVYEEDINKVLPKFPSLTINYDPSKLYISFADPEVLRVLLSKSVGDGTGVTENQAGNVTNIGSWFVDNTTIETFDEFEKFTGMTTINGSASVKGGFTNCANLRSIKLPKTLESIYGGSDQYSNTGCFKNCTALLNIIIPPNISVIPGYCFKGCTSLTDVILEGIIHTIGGNAFNGCSSLIMQIPSSVTILGSYAFCDTNMEGVEVDLPNLTSMDGYGHFANSNIKKVNNLGSITKLDFQPNSPGYYGQVPSFYKCTKLEYVNLPNTLISIGRNMFQGCTSLSEVHMSETIEVLSAEVFSGCSSLTKINLPTSIKKLNGSVFYNCKSMTIEDLQLPNLETLGQNAFYGVKIKKISNLGKITALPASSNSIQNYGDNGTLEEVVLPETLTEIPSYSFYNYSSLKQCIIPESVTIIGVSAFSYCPIEGNLYLPNLSSLGSYAFHGTKFSKIVSLGTITVTPDGNSSSNVFGNCTNLKEVRLPATLTKIGSYTFRGSKALQTIICEATTPPSMGVNPFYGTNSTFIIYVPDESVEAYKTATNWSTYADRIKPLSEYVES